PNAEDHDQQRHDDERVWTPERELDDANHDCLPALSSGAPARTRSGTTADGLLRMAALPADVEGRAPLRSGHQLDQIGGPMPNGFLGQGGPGQQDARAYRFRAR